MPRLVSPKQLDEIESVIAAHPGGAGRDAIASALSGHINPRTLQRRLRQLVQNGRVVARREQRLVRYLAPATVQPAAAGPSITEVRHEQPTGYDPALLAAYRFDRTRRPYLDDSRRDELRTLATQWRSASADLKPTIPATQLVDCAWGSACLDGCTYSRTQFERLVKDGVSAVGKSPFESQSALNHHSAMRYALAAAAGLDTERSAILEAHALLTDGLLDDPGEGGCVRDAPLEVPGSLYRPLASRQRLEELLDATLSAARHIDDPFEQAFFLLVHLSYLQPFSAANTAVARVIANIALLRRGHCPISYVGVSGKLYNQSLLNLYESKRIEPLRDLFIRAFETTCRRAIAARDQPLSPTAFRMQHRIALDEAVRTLVRGGWRGSGQAVREFMPARVAPADHDRFTALVLSELRALHAGNAVRFALQPDEVQRWKEVQ